jgi:hypothetical protein
VLAGAGLVSITAAEIKSAERLPPTNFVGPVLGPALPIASGKSSGDPVAPGTLRMAERMRVIKARADRGVHPYLSEGLVTRYRRALEQKLPPNEEASLRLRLAQQLLNSGASAEAIQALDDLDSFLQRNGFQSAVRDEQFVRYLRGLCYLRLGEQQNCLIRHTSESCLLPIQPGGIHLRPEGSRAAIEIFSSLLRERTNDLALRWLLNIAHMTLGEYPDKVAPEWLIPPSVWASDYDIKRFPDVAGALGLDVNNLAGGSILEDFDGDGNLDLMVSNWQLDGPFRFFRNDGKGHFVERTKEAGLGPVLGGLNIQQTDYNNDGNPDVFILRGAWLQSEGHHPNSLLRNNGDGTFEDVTDEANLLSFHPTQAATWFDYNGDGWLDVFIANETVGKDTNACELFRNNGNGTFTECAAESGLALIGFFKGVGSGDYDGDGRPDLFLSERDGGNRLIRNAGPAPASAGATNRWQFVDVTAAAGIGRTEASFSTWFFDYDNDGWLDIFVAGYALTDVGDVAADYMGLPHHGERARLYHNNHNGTFSDVSVAAKLFKVIHGMGHNYGDLDNDGWLDFYVGTGDPNLATLIPNRMFRNAEGKYFQEVTTSGGFGHLQKGHAISFGDIDNDGDQDIFAKMGGAFSGDIYRSSLFLNPGHSNHWVGLKLVGVKSNRVAIGARIKVVVQTGSGTRDIYKTVNSGGSFGSSPLRQQLGLGQAKSIDRVEIFWPVTGQTQIVRGVEMDRFHRISEGAPVAVAMDIRPIKLDFKGMADPFCAPTNINATATLPIIR